MPTDTPLPQPNSVKDLLAAGAVDLKRIAPDGVSAPLAILPAGYRAEVIDWERASFWLPSPLRKTGHFDFADVDSFCRYFNEHKTDSSRVFASVCDTGANFRGVLNFHGQQPSFNDHTCSFSLKPTHEWNAWCVNAGKHMTQAAFATFLEENAELFTDPKGADLLELVTTLEGKANVLVNSAIKMQTGAIKLAYSEEIELKGGVGTQSGEMLVPALLGVAIAPFEGTSRYQMSARLRYRIESRKMEFWYQPVDPHLVVRHVTADILAIIEKQTGVTPFKT